MRGNHFFFTFHFWGNKKKCKIKIQVNFYFNSTFRNARGKKGLMVSYFMDILKRKKWVNIVRYRFIVSWKRNTTKHQKQSQEVFYKKVF